MTITSDDYARLADYSYGRDEKGNRVDLGAMVGKTAVIGGVRYEVRAHADRPSGYQGTVYQRVDTGEIVVAHRGTEFDRQKWEDLVKADGLMAFSRFNPQADDAIALSREAVRLGRDYASENRVAAPPITHTGHSLGGTLAQVSGHYFGQGGETFNAYGAASLNIRNPATGGFYRMQAGGDAFLNHVMGADFVSAGSPQYGQTRVYTDQREIDTLQRWGYANDRSSLLDPRADVVAAVAAMAGGSHDMHNFLPWDGNNRPDVSILADPGARRLAAQYDPMIDKFRADVFRARDGFGFFGTNLKDVIQTFREPLPPGEPARREEQQRKRGASLEDGAVPDMREPTHPANGMYRQAYAGVSALDRTLGRAPDAASERLAASLTAAGAGLTDIGQVALSRDGSRAFALEAPRGPAESRNRADVEVATAVQRPVEDSTRDWQDAALRLATERAQAQALERDTPAPRNAIVA